MGGISFVTLMQKNLGFVINTKVLSFKFSSSQLIKIIKFLILLSNNLNNKKNV